MSKQDATRVELSYAVNFVTALRSLEENLRDLENSQVIISGFLKAATEFYDADRSYVIEADWNENIAMNTHEWCKDGIEYAPVLQATVSRSYDSPARGGLHHAYHQGAWQI